MNKVKVLPDTISQLKSLKENWQSLINPDDDPLENQIWIDDIAALDNAIEIIKDYQLQKENIFKPGQAVVYKPKNYKGEVYKEEPGIVKRMGVDGKVAFVWYHEGCTAAATPIEFLEESHITKAHTKIHHGCEECVSNDPEALTEYIFD